MQPLIEAAVKSYSQTETGELVRLRDGEIAIVGLIGKLPDQEKILVCIPNPRVGAISFFAHSVEYDDEVLSFGKDIGLYFDPITARIEPSSLVSGRISGALLIGPHTWAITVPIPNRPAVLGGLEVTIRISSEQSNQSRTRFAVLDWEMRLPSAGLNSAPIYTYHAA